MIKRLWIGLAMLFITMGAFASHHTTVESLRNAMNEVVGSIKAHEDHYRANPDVLREVIRPVMNEYFDMGRISKWVLGKRWRTMDVQQRDRFDAAFRNLLLKTYGTVLVQGLDKEITWSSVRESRNNQGEVTSAVVKASTTTDSGGEVEIDFYLRQNPKKYKGVKVYDVKVNGVSLVTNYRGTFSQIIQREGVEAFLLQLEAKSG